MEGMIAVLDGDECGALAKRLRKLAHQSDVGQRITGSLQEQHGDLHIEEMGGALLRGATSRLQWKAEESETAHMRERSFGLRKQQCAPRWRKRQG